MLSDTFSVEVRTGRYIFLVWVVVVVVKEEQTESGRDQGKTATCTSDVICARKICARVLGAYFCGACCFCYKGWRIMQSYRDQKEWGYLF